MKPLPPDMPVSSAVPGRLMPLLSMSKSKVMRPSLFSRMLVTGLPTLADEPVCHVAAGVVSSVNSVTPPVPGEGVGRLAGRVGYPLVVSGHELYVLVAGLRG